MSAFYVMISISLLIALGFLGAFLWSVKRGHYDDDYTPSIRILMDDNSQNHLNSKFASSTQNQRAKHQK
jgi:cbb3-type cytochrome oxidase maturation protein